MWWTPVRLAVQTLGANPLRTALSTLGIVMGAASLSAVLSLGDGAEAFARRRVEGEGLQIILVSAKTADRIDGLRVPRARIVTFTPEDAKALSRTLGPRVGVSLAARTVVRWREASHGPEHAAVAQGVVNLGLTNAPRLQAGRALGLSDTELGTDAAVVSASVARTLSSSGAREAVGRTLTVDTRRLRVVGVLVEPVGPDQPLVQVPFGVFAAWPVQVGADPPTIAIRAERVEAVEPLRAAVQAWVSPRYE